MVLSNGSRGEQVVQLQERLGLTADGIFGRKTEKAVIDYQSRHDLHPDGIVGDMTWGSLFPSPQNDNLTVVTIMRGEPTVEGTQGIVFIDGDYFCSTLELNDYDNLPYYSCIPKGRYHCSYSYSPTFKRNLYMVNDVPNRTGIRIHPATWAGDTREGLRSDLLGCITLGSKVVQDKQLMILESKKWVDKFEAKLDGRDFILEIQ